MNKSYFAVSLLIGSLACAGDETAPAGPTEVPIGVTPQTPVPVDHPSMNELAVRSRGPRRLSVDQIERALDQIANLPSGSVRLPEDLAITLGRPDYVRTTEETLEPSPLFMKFMVDLGGIMCTNIGDGDRARPAEDRVFTRYDTPQENLRYMVLRFTGIDGPDADAYVDRLMRVYDAASASARPLGGYEGACIALFTSPEFLLY